MPKVAMLIPDAAALTAARPGPGDRSGGGRKENHRRVCLAASQTGPPAQFHGPYLDLLASNSELRDERKDRLPDGPSTTSQQDALASHSGGSGVGSPTTCEGETAFFIHFFLTEV